MHIPPTPRPTLRQLPLPAKLVVSVFLITVGLGYFSALVQMHLQHSSREGEPLPTSDDVVAVFAGVKKFDPNAPAPVSKLEKLVMGPIEGAPWNGNGSMAAAFFHKDVGDFRAAIKDDPNLKAKLEAEREGERLAIKTWIQHPELVRKAAYDADLMVWKDQTITSGYRAGDAVKVKAILDERCVRCHSKDGDVPAFPLDTYDHLLKYMGAPPAVPDADGWIPSGRQTSVEKLTQSTHAHLLSFAMLFGLTGFLFAFTGLPKKVRMVFAPLVLVAQVADISCWWLARVPGYGPYFAYMILGTGGLVGMGLTIHILGCLFDMYNRRGRIVLVCLFACGSAGFCVLYVKVIEPVLNAQKAAKP